MAPRQRWILIDHNAWGIRYLGPRVTLLPLPLHSCRSWPKYALAHRPERCFFSYLSELAPKPEPISPQFAAAGLGFIAADMERLIYGAY